MVKEAIDCIDAGTEYCPWGMKKRFFGKGRKGTNYFFLESSIPNILILNLRVSPFHLIHSVID